MREQRFRGYPAAPGSKTGSPCLLYTSIVQVIAKDGKEIENMTEAYTEAAGTMINSGAVSYTHLDVYKRQAVHIGACSHYDYADGADL